VSKVLCVAEVLFVMESSATPVTVAIPVAMPLPSISVVMTTVFAPILPIPASFLALPVATVIIASPIEIPMLAGPVVTTIAIVMTVSHGHRRT
jgi:hypothetical protein